MKSVISLVMLVVLCFYMLWRIKRLPKDKSPIIKIIEIKDYGDDKIVTVKWKFDFIGNQEEYIAKGPHFRKFYRLHSGNRCVKNVERTLRRHFALIRGGEESYSPNNQ